MRLIRFEIAKLKIGLKKPFITALRRVDEIEDIIIKLHTDIGLVGYGEACAVTAITGTTNKDVIHDLEKTLFPLLLDKEVELEGIFTLLHNAIACTEAKACVDIALYDLLSKQASQSLHAYLGSSSNVLQTDLTISVNTPLLMKEASIKALALGFKNLKIKLDSEVLTNIQRLRQINEVLSSGIHLRLDPNQALDLKGCLEILKNIPTENIECIEQPFSAKDISSMKQLKDKRLVPVLADESLFSLSDAQMLLDEDAIDILNIKLMKCAGIYEAIKIASLAKSHKKTCMIGSMLEGPISLLAAAHFALSQSNILMADLDSPLYLKEHPLLEPFHMQKDCIHLSNDLGIGVDKIIENLHFFQVQ